MLKRLELSGFKSFAKKTILAFDVPITAIVGPNGSGKSNVAEAFRWALGEQSLKSLRGKRGEDLIFHGSGETGRLSRAAVSVVFANQQRTLPVDFDEVTITREVYRDGANEYLINGSKVRLRDVLELLSAVSLGAAGHHIISQGEADRVLNASIFDRRTMIEEALGLRLYQWKLEESRKKLDKTEENIKQVESLRREIAPHLKFLAKQVEKIAKADALRQELAERYRAYLKKEEMYLALTRRSLESEREAPARELAQVEEKLAQAEKTLASEDGHDQGHDVLLVERRLNELRAAKDDIVRRLGRLEGMIEIKNERARETAPENAPLLARSVVEEFTTRIGEIIDEALMERDTEAIKAIILRVREAVSRFWQEKTRTTPSASVRQEELEKLLVEKVALEEERRAKEGEEKEMSARLATLRRAIETKREESRGAEREVFALRARRSELGSALETLRAKDERYRLEAENFAREVEEAATLVNQEIRRFTEQSLPASYDALTDRPAQEEERRAIERIKIRLEDMGGEGGDVLEEYQETKKRDEFLAREHDDLERSQSDLEQVITDLITRLDHDFTQGVKKINIEFQKFFALMFGGGTARLDTMSDPRRGRRTEAPAEILEAVASDSVVAEEEQPAQGIEITVSLPRKKIRGLQMLSGGERALTSIALLFAMSQVNPPPFLILDETDAALDEANSRKYGDLIESLSRYSQLIVITHNRETMSRAGVIYGVTMGGDATSRLLSIKFDQAAEFAK